MISAAKAFPAEAAFFVHRAPPATPFETMEKEVEPVLVSLDSW